MSRESFDPISIDMLELEIGGTVTSIMNNLPRAGFNEFLTETGYKRIKNDIRHLISQSLDGRTTAFIVKYIAPDELGSEYGSFYQGQAQGNSLHLFHTESLLPDDFAEGRSKRGVYLTDVPTIVLDPDEIKVHSEIDSS